MQPFTSSDVSRRPRHAHCLSELPDFVLAEIQKLLDPYSIERARLVSKTWREAFRTERSSLNFSVVATSLPTWQRHVTACLAAFPAVKALTLKLPTHMSTQPYGQDEQEAFQRIIQHISSYKISELTLTHVYRPVAHPGGYQMVLRESVLDRGADLSILNTMPHLTTLKLAFVVKIPHLQQLASIKNLRSLDLASDVGGISDKHVLAVSQLSSLTGLTHLAIRVLRSPAMPGMEIHQEDAHILEQHRLLMGSVRNVGEEDRILTGMMLRAVVGLSCLKQLLVVGLRPSKEAQAMAWSLLPHLELLDMQRSRHPYTLNRPSTHLTHCEWSRQRHPVDPSTGSGSGPVDPSKPPVLVSLGLRHQQPLAGPPNWQGGYNVADLLNMAMGPLPPFVPLGPVPVPGPPLAAAPAPAPNPVPAAAAVAAGGGAAPGPLSSAPAGAVGQGQGPVAASTAGAAAVKIEGEPSSHGSGSAGPAAPGPGPVSVPSSAVPSPRGLGSGLPTRQRTPGSGKGKGKAATGSKGDASPSVGGASGSGSKNEPPPDEPSGKSNKGKGAAGSSSSRHRRRQGPSSRNAEGSAPAAANPAAAGAGPGAGGPAHPPAPQQQHPQQLQPMTLGQMIGGILQQVMHGIGGQGQGQGPAGGGQGPHAPHHGHHGPPVQHVVNITTFVPAQLLGGHQGGGGGPPPGLMAMMNGLMPPGMGMGMGMLPGGMGVMGMGGALLNPMGFGHPPQQHPVGQPPQPPAPIHQQQQHPAGAAAAPSGAGGAPGGASTSPPLTTSSQQRHQQAQPGAGAVSASSPSAPSSAAASGRASKRPRTSSHGEAGPSRQSTMAAATAARAPSVAATDAEGPGSSKAAVSGSHQDAAGSEANGGPAGPSGSAGAGPSSSGIAFQVKAELGSAAGPSGSHASGSGATPPSTTAGGAPLPGVHGAAAAGVAAPGYGAGGPDSDHSDSPPTLVDDMDDDTDDDGFGHGGIEDMGGPGGMAYDPFGAAVDAGPWPNPWHLGQDMPVFGHMGLVEAGQHGQVVQLNPGWNGEHMLHMPDAPAHAPGNQQHQQQDEPGSDIIMQALAELLPATDLSHLTRLCLHTRCKSLAASQLAGLSALTALTQLRLVAEPTGRLPADQQACSMAELLSQIGTLAHLRDLELAGLHMRLDARALKDNSPLLQGLTRLAFEGRYALRQSDTAVFQGLSGLKTLELRQSRADPFLQQPKLCLPWLPQGLERLELRQIEVLGPPVDGLPQLQKLVLRDCHVASMEAFGRCPQLHHVDHNQMSSYRRNPVTQALEVLQPLAMQWQGLVSLRLNMLIPYDQVSAEALEEQFLALQGLPRLRNLMLQSYCRNSGHPYTHMHRAVRHLAQLPLLRSLYLNPVSAQAVREIAKLSQLVHLRLGSVPAHSVMELRVLTQLKSLQYSEEQGRWAHDGSSVRMDPVTLHFCLARAMPLTTIIDNTTVAGYGGFVM